MRTIQEYVYIVCTILEYVCTVYPRYSSTKFHSMVNNNTVIFVLDNSSAIHACIIISVMYSLFCVHENVLFKCHWL